ncbi:GNAT family N-acetyltransferase [Streptomyces sp. NPDC047014]|uniref:GNAT family N-acetyltransferase n=1 Tax=Streptomyces sp. NPDC047014 TaxID=3155736 RepID=UPI0033E41C2F
MRFTDTATYSAGPDLDTLNTLNRLDTLDVLRNPAEQRLNADLLPLLAEADLLDSPATWGSVPTPAGAFRLEPVRPGRDLELITGWMNDPEVDAYWELAGPAAVTASHLRSQLDGGSGSIPCLGLLDGTPMSYWELYRADLDPLSRHYPARPHDTGIHLLIGDGTNRGRGLGTALLRAVTDLVLGNRPRCTRVIAEPDIRNTPSVSAFLNSGFRWHAEIDLPEKRAALMIRERALRNLL